MAHKKEMGKQTYGYRDVFLAEPAPWSYAQVQKLYPLQNK